MQRFASSKKKISTNMLRTTLLFAAIVICVIWATRSIANGTSNEQKQYLEDAVRRKAIYCYSVEGAYPEDVSYIEENYGLSYDEKSFYIGYRLHAANMMPDITIIDIRSK